MEIITPWSFFAIPLVAGLLLDMLWGDPERLPHPVRFFGNWIAWYENRFNNGEARFSKGLLLTLLSVIGSLLLFGFADWAFRIIHPIAGMVFATFFVYLGLGHKSLISEGKKVIYLLNQYGEEKARKQLSRIVGRNTENLNEQQIRTAVLESLAENLSDGVIAPVFYYSLAGIPGLMTYKMVNTLDSMVGYKSRRFKAFGKASAILDDILNYIPARITGYLMAASAGSLRAFRYISRYSRQHSSPNAGFPESALAGILNGRFGGPSHYYGQVINKPWIGEEERTFTDKDLRKAIRVNHATTLLFIGIMLGMAYICPLPYYQTMSSFGKLW